MDVKQDSSYSLPLKDAAMRLPISSALLYQLVRTGVVPSIRLGKKYYLRPADITFIKKHGTTQLPKPVPVVSKENNHVR